MQDLQKGTELANRYTLVSKLGVGGAAQTWLATDRMTRADVALKILADDRLSVADLRKEWQTGIRLMHAHVVRVFEFNDDPDCPFYSLQYVDGPDIGVLAGIPAEQILAPVALIADALRYAHGKDIVHGDVKAGNILLDHNGAPYLIDFGVATTDGAGAGGGSLIAASPQTLSGAPAQPTDDIFALGGLIYELVAGQSPYSSQATADDIRDRLPEPLCTADGTAIAGPLQDLVASMLDKDAAQRPDAAAVVAALRDAGIAAAPAPASLVSTSRAGASEIIEIGDSVRLRSPVAAATKPQSPAAGSQGLSARTVTITLVALLAILTAVVFLLPGTVPSERRSEVAGTGQQHPAGQDQPGGAGSADPDDEQVARDERVIARAETETVLGELLTKMDTLDKRAVQRWGGLRYKQAQEVYAAGDEAYLARNYETAMENYRQAIQIVEPLLDEVDSVFATTYAAAQEALAAADAPEALRLFELAVAISPSHAAVQAGYARALNLDTVLALTDQGLAHEKELELDAARQSFATAVELDGQWAPANEGLARVLETIRQMEFDQRMTEGLTALAERDYAGARAAFRVAKTLKPESREPADGLMQVDQGIRLNRIIALEARAQAQEQNEEWETAVSTYESILEIDADLQFAQEGLERAERMAALHERLGGFIADPDKLSAPATMRSATTLVVDITRMPEVGPRLGDERDQLSRLLKRAATPLKVTLESDNITDVAIYKVGKLGSFTSHELSLRPGTYVAVGSRPGYRDVRLEFRVGPEIEPRPIVVRCEEAI